MKFMSGHSRRKRFHGSVERWHEMSPEVKSSWKYVWNSSSGSVGTSATGLKLLSLWCHLLLCSLFPQGVNEWDFRDLNPNPGSITPRVICDPWINYLTLKHQFFAFCKAKQKWKIPISEICCNGVSDWDRCGHSLSENSQVKRLQYPWTVACQAPLSMQFSRPQYWSG